MLPEYRHFCSEEKLMGRRGRFARKKGISSLIRGCILSAESQNTTESNYRNDSLLATWAESFIFAGTSALLLLIARLLPYYWYFSLFALVPFLYRIIKTTPTESLRLGILLGISYFAVSVTDSLSVSPISSLLKLFLGTGLFAIFGWTVGWARKYWGFNPSIVTILWAGLEISLTKLGFANGILGKTRFSDPFLDGLVGLFGFLIVSAIIVLLDSLLVLAIIKTLEAIRHKKNTVGEVTRKWLLFFTDKESSEKVYLLPEGRAPPICIFRAFVLGG